MGTTFITAIRWANADMVPSLTLEKLILSFTISAEMIFPETNKTSFLLNEKILSSSRVGHYFAGVRGMALFTICTSGS